MCIYIYIYTHMAAAAAFAVAESGFGAVTGSPGNNSLYHCND